MFLFSLLCKECLKRIENEFSVPYGSENKDPSLLGYDAV
jgi:hypothetical protein